VSQPSTSANRRGSRCLGTPKAASYRSGRRTKTARLAAHAAAERGSNGFVRRRPEKHEWETIQELLASSRTKFVGLAYTILRNREDAEDAVQDALVSAVRHLGAFEGRSALTTWFTRIVLNAALMIRRKRRPGRIEALPEACDEDEISWTERIPDSRPDPETAVAEKETFHCIEGLVRKMNPLLRQAFTMTYHEELTSEEAGALLGVATGTFKSRVFRAKRDLLTRAQRLFAGQTSNAARSVCPSNEFSFPLFATRAGETSSVEAACS
jgi:RNA polymerase sigma-70 factor, ECF subfamily